MGTRRLSIGCDFRYSAAVPTPAVVQVTPLGGEGVSIEVEQWYLEPAQDRTHEYRDLYGNRCQRMVLPAGSSRIGYQALVTVPDATEDADPSAPEWAPQALPDDVLVYLMPSRYCLPDMLGQEAWSRFSLIPPGYGRVQAICDHVNNHLQFAY